METWALVLVALALSIDNCSIALAVGAQNARRTLGATLRLPLVFGAFAAAAAALGWLAGSQIASAMSKYGSVLACGILVYVGWRTLRSAWIRVSAGIDASSLPAALMLGVSTSFDSLTVGVAMALSHASVGAFALVNGIVCSLLSLGGVLVGERLGASFPAQSKFVAGLVLIAVGLRALAAAHP